MKKVSLLAFILSATAANVASAADAGSSAASCPKAFQGFHLGGIIGYDAGHGKFKQNNDDTATNIKNNRGFSGLGGGVGVGYTHRFGNFALGLAFDATWANTSGEDKTVVDSTTINKLKLQLQDSMQLYARAGYVIGGQAMPFVGLGWDNSKWKVSESGLDNNGDNFKKHQHKRMDGLLWKAGVDFLATKHVVVGLEYTGTTAHKKYKKLENISVRPQNNRFAFTAKVVY